MYIIVKLLDLVYDKIIITCNLTTGASDNVTYLYNFGDGTYSLTTCPNMSHVYTRVGAVTIEVSARNNISGPIVARAQFYLQSTVGLVDLTCPDDVIATEADTDYFVNVSQGTLMNVTWYWPFQVTTKFGLSGKFILAASFVVLCCVVS